MKIYTDVSGAVWTVEVSLGQEVREGEVLLVVESMKMEIPITASVNGVIKEIFVAKGELVEDGQCILEME